MEGSEFAWLAVLRAPLLGAAGLRRAIASTGGVEALLGCPQRLLLSLGLAAESAAALASPPRELIEADLAWCRQQGVQLMPFTACDFPPQLADLPDAPALLLLQGRRELLAQPQIAVVGSRQPTAAGRRIAFELAGQLAAAGLIITSGMARGIDTAAHEGALAAGGRTIAICGTGLDQCYPPENQPLRDRIIREGLLVSEFPRGTPPARHNFPRRNRIISGLARGTLVVEAAAGSGSLITARKALEQGREVFAVPGSPLNPLAAGCLELLTEGAHLVRGADDVLAQVQIEIEKDPDHNLLSDQKLASVQSGASCARRLDKDYEMLLDALGFEPASIDDLVDRTGLTPGSVASMMLILELEGRVEPRPGALFNRVSD
ncbi:MAG: DNA-processing protein DprA [Steroidobacteraceae bacterium]